MPRPIQTNSEHRRLVLKALLWVTLCCGVFFSILNGLRDYWLLAGLELAYAAVSLCMLRVIDRTRHLQTLTVIYLIPFFTIMMVILFQPHISFTTYAWIQTIPIIFYLLLGLRAGLWGSLLFIGIGLFAFSRRYAPDDQVLNVMVISDIGLASLAVLIFSHIYERSRLRTEQRLTELATTDSLTGLVNRIRLSEVFERERAHSLRNRTPLSLVFLDIDHFKQINDRFGHEAGDQALRHFAALLGQRLRASDLFCRLGGEEFAVLLPATDRQQAVQIAEVLRERLAGNPLPVDGQALHITLSAGVATLGEDGESLHSLMQAADRRTYAAKRSGRNRVVADDEAPLPPPQA